MSVSLSKGGNVSLTKVAGEAGLKKVRVGLGWDARVTDGAEFDLDASAFCLNADSKCAGEHDFVFYNNKTSSDGAVQHTGDNRSGSGAGDDESIVVDLEKVAAGIAKVDFTVTIYEATARKQNFGMVSNAYIRVVNEADGAELARYDLSEDASTETAMVFGQLYKNGTEWKFKAIGQGFAGGLGALASNYGISAA